MMKRMILRAALSVGAFSCVFLAFIGGVLWGQSDDDSRTPPRPKVAKRVVERPKGPLTAIVDATMYTMTAGEKKPFQGVLLFQGERILKAGHRLAIPPGTQVLNARGKVVTPGLAIANTRLGLVEISLEGSTRNDVSRARSDIRAAYRVSYGFNYTSSLIPIARVEGITSVMVRPFGGLISGLSMIVDLWGLPEQMAVRDGLGMHATLSSGRSADQWLRLDQVIDEVRYFLAHQADYNMGRARKLKLSRKKLMALSRVVKRSIPLILEVHRSADILRAIRFAREEQVRLVLVGASEAWMVAKQLARSYIPVLLHPPHNLPVRFDRLGSRYDNAAILSKAGVLFAFGSRGGAHNIRSLRHEAGIAAAWGLSRYAALRALTTNLYEIFHLTQHYGTLEQGKVANIVLWSGDPLELSTRAEQVWIRGKKVPMVSRQTLLRDRYRSLKGLYRQPRP